MQNVREIITETLGQRGINATSYAQYVDPVVQRLEGEVASVVEKAKTVMSEQGLDEQDQTDILVTVGLIPEPEEQASAGEGDGALAQQVADLQKTVEEQGTLLSKAVEFAKRHGLNV